MIEVGPQKKDENWLDWLERVCNSDNEILLDRDETIEGIQEIRQIIIDLKEKISKLQKFSFVKDVK